MDKIIDVEYRAIIELEDKDTAVLAAEANAFYHQAEAVAIESVRMLVAAGQRLRIIKERVGHGNWLDWVTSNLSFEKSKAEYVMKLAERDEAEGGLFSNSHTCGNIGISKIRALLEAPEEVAKEVMETTKIEDVTVRELKAELKRVKEENKALSEASEDDKEKVRNLNELVANLRADMEAAREMQKEAERELAAVPDSSELQEALEGAKKETSELERKLTEAEHEMKGMKARLASEREALKQKAAEEAKAAAEKAEKEAQGQIDAKVEEAIADALKDADGEIETLRKEIDRQRKLADPATGEFGAHADSMQREFNACLAAIEKAEPDKRSEWRGAMKKVIKMMEGQL